ncbi:MAG: redoxin domain-containing protein [Chlamydiota bacterium]
MAAIVTQEAPSFVCPAVMPDNTIGEVNLGAYRGKYLILFFYPLDFTTVCTSEVTLFNEAFEKFQMRQTELLGVSVDSPATHLSWKNTPPNHIMTPEI